MENLQNCIPPDFGPNIGSMLLIRKSSEPIKQKLKYIESKCKGKQYNTVCYRMRRTDPMYVALLYSAVGGSGDGGGGALYVAPYVVPHCTWVTVWSPT